MGVEQEAGTYHDLHLKRDVPGFWGVLLSVTFGLSMFCGNSTLVFEAGLLGETPLARPLYLI